MIGGILASASFIDFGNVLGSLQQAGFFSYILPFLLIFALVFGIMSRMNLFKENRAVTAIIALAVGLMSLQFDTVPRFFSTIFPNFGIAISIILVLLIVIGLFVDPKKPWLMYVLLAISAIIVIVVLVNTSTQLGIPAGEWFAQNWTTVLTVLIIGGVIIGFIATAINSGKNRTDKGNPENYRAFLVGPPKD
jgi:hypothetical protein